jgi:hypothetical protein
MIRCRHDYSVCIRAERCAGRIMALLHVKALPPRPTPQVRCGLFAVVSAAVASRRVAMQPWVCLCSRQMGIGTPLPALGSRRERVPREPPSGNAHTIPSEEKRDQRRGGRGRRGAQARHVASGF